MPLRKSRKNKKTFRKHHTRKYKKKSSARARKIIKKNRKKSNKKRKSKKRKSRKNKHVVARKKYMRNMRGGNCIGSCLNKYNLQFNDNPLLPDPKYLHTNQISSNMQGGGVMHDFGLGDLLSGYYQGGTQLTNQFSKYKGHKGATSPNVLNQPRLNKEYQTKIQHPDIESSHSSYSNRL
jgi:hypothetical protein